MVAEMAVDHRSGHGFVAYVAAEHLGLSTGHTRRTCAALELRIRFSSLSQSLVVLDSVRRWHDYIETEAVTWLDSETTTSIPVGSWCCRCIVR